MMSEYFSHMRRQAVDRISCFGRDVGMVFQALVLWGIIFLLVEIVLGLLPLVIVLTLGSTVDAMIGARGIGVVTSDLNQELVRWLTILIVAFLAYLFSARFTGKAGEVGRGLRDATIFTSLLVYLITINQILLALMFLSIIVIDFVWSSDMRIRIVSLLVAILAGSLIAHTLVRFTVARSFTVGEGLAMIGAIVMFVVCLKMRIAYAQNS